MTGEIKEILYKIEHGIDIGYIEYDWFVSYITALEEENKELKLLSMTQNNREYRSKFLKEYQKEHGKNCYPDYDEIYKRYDKLKSNNDAAIEYVNNHKKQLHHSFDEPDFDYLLCVNADELLNILQGDDNNDSK